MNRFVKTCIRWSSGFHGAFGVLVICESAQIPETRLLVPQEQQLVTIRACLVHAQGRPRQSDILTKRLSVPRTKPEGDAKHCTYSVQFS